MSGDAFTVSGPGVDRRAGSAALGLSAAITCANVATRARQAASFYVRDAAGEVVGRADADGAGCVQVYGKRALDRAPSGPLDAASGPLGGRSKPTRASGGATLEGERESAPHGPRVASEAPPARPIREEAPPMSDKQQKKDLDGELADQVAPKVSAKEAAVRVLKRADGPMHVSEIVKAVMKTRGVKLGGKTPGATIQAMLVTENKKPDGLFVRTEKATFALREKVDSKGGAKAEKAGAAA